MRTRWDFTVASVTDRARRDLAVGPALGEQHEHLALTRAEELLGRARRAGGSSTAPGERAVQRRARRTARPCRAASTTVPSSSASTAAQPDAAGAQRERGSATVVLVGRRQQHDDAGRGRSARAGAPRRRRQVGGRADHDEVGPVERRDARRARGRSGSRPTTSIPRASSTADDPGAHQRQLVGDDARVSARRLRAHVATCEPPEPLVTTTILHSARQPHAQAVASFNPAVNQEQTASAPKPAPDIHNSVWIERGDRGARREASSSNAHRHRAGRERGPVWSASTSRSCSTWSPRSPTGCRAT